MNTGPNLQQESAKPPAKEITPGLPLYVLDSAAGMASNQVAFYIELFKKVRETPEWKKMMSDGAFNQSFMTGTEYAQWVAGEEGRHRDLMKEAGFLAAN